MFEVFLGIFRKGQAKERQGLACAPCAVKTCAVRPVVARVVGQLRAADPSK